MDSTISAIARAHRETFLYAHDKLANNHVHHNGEAELWQPNRCPNGYHANGLNTIYHHNNNLATECYLPGNSRTHLHRSNGRQSQQSGHAGHVTQEQRCPVKKQTGIVLVRAHPLGEGLQAVT